MKTYLTKFAKSLRNNPTDTEKRLWYFLRTKQLRGLKFRRQAPIGHYIVDFVCFPKKFVIELDGGQHAEAKHKEKDDARDAWLTSQGFTVLRFWDNDILQNIEGVGEKIVRYCDTLPQPPPIDGGGKLN